MIRLTRVRHTLLNKRSTTSVNPPKSKLIILRNLCSALSQKESDNAGGLEAPTEEATLSEKNDTTRTRRRASVKFTNKNILLRQLEGLEGKGDISSSSVYKFIKSCGQDMYGETADSKIKLVKEVWNRFKAKGVEMDVSHYNALLGSYVQNGYIFSPLDFLAEMQENNVKPNFVTFLYLVRAYSARGDMHGALKVIEFMNKENFRLSELIYSALIEGYGKKGDIDNALEVLSIMRENDCPPGLTAYGALLGAYAFQGNWDKIDKVLQDMAWQKIVPNASTYIAILDGLSQGGHQHLIKEVLPKVEDKDVFKTDGRDLVKLMISRGDNHGALELATYLQSITEQQDDGKDPTRIFLGTLYTASSSAENFLNAMKMMEEKGLISTPIEDTLDYCHWKKDPAGALKMIEELRAAERPVKIHYFYPIVKTLADHKDFEGLRNAFTVLGRQQIPLDDSLIEFIKRGLGNTPGVEEIITALVKESGVQIPAKTAASLLDKALEAGDLEQVISILPSVHYGQIIADDKFAQIEALIKSEFNAEKAAQVYKILNGKKIMRIGSSIGRVIDHVTATDSAVEGKDVVKFVKELMEADVKNMTSKIYSKTLAIIYKNRLKDDFFEVVRLMKEHDIQADEHQYIQMLKMSSYIGNSAAAQFCFDKIKQSPIIPNSNMYSNLIAAYWADRSRDGGGVQEENMLQMTNVYEAMKEKEMKPPAGIVSSIAIAYLMQQRIDEADDFVKEHGPGNRPLHVYNAYLKAYARVGRIEDVEKLFKWMKTADDAPRPTHNSYHNVMSAYRVEGNVDRVQELMAEMKQEGLPYLKLTNMELVKSFLEKRDISGALDSLQKIEDPEAYPYEVLYRRIVRDLKAANDIQNLQRAKEIFHAQECKSPSPREIDSLCLFLLVKNGQNDEALAMMKSASWHGHPLDVKRIAEESTGDIVFLEPIKKLYAEAGNPTYVFDHALLRHYGRSNNVEKALELYKEKVESGHEIAESFQTRLEELVRANQREIPSYPVYFGRRALAFIESMLSAYLKL